MEGLAILARKDLRGLYKLCDQRRTMQLPRAREVSTANFNFS